VVECSFITEFEDHIFVTVDADAFFFLHDLIMSYLKEKEKVVSPITSRKPVFSPQLPLFQMVNQNQQQQQRSQSPVPSQLTPAAAMGSSNNVSATPSQPTPQPDPTSPSVATPETTATASTSPTTSQTHPPDDLRHKLGAKNVNAKIEKMDLDALLRTDWRHFNCKTWHLEPTVRLLSWAGKSIEPYGIDYILNKLGFNHARTTIPKWLQRGFMDPLDKVEALLMDQLLAAVKENKTESGGGEKAANHDTYDSNHKY
jgi:Fragile site-associated protein C-terminus